MSFSVLQSGPATAASPATAPSASPESGTGSGCATGTWYINIQTIARARARTVPTPNCLFPFFQFYGNAGDSLHSHNGLPFSTFDVDNDEREGDFADRSCARLYKVSEREVERSAGSIGPRFLSFLFRGSERPLKSTLLADVVYLTPVDSFFFPWEKKGSTQTLQGLWLLKGRGSWWRDFTPLFSPPPSPRSLPPFSFLSFGLGERHHHSRHCYRLYSE